MSVASLVQLSFPYTKKKHNIPREFKPLVG